MSDLEGVKERVRQADQKLSAAQEGYEQHIETLREMLTGFEEKLTARDAEVEYCRARAATLQAEKDEMDEMLQSLLTKVEASFNDHANAETVTPQDATVGHQDQDRPSPDFDVGEGGVEDMGFEAAEVDAPAGEVDAMVDEAVDDAAAALDEGEDETISDDIEELLAQADGHETADFEGDDGIDAAPRAAVEEETEGEVEGTPSLSAPESIKALLERVRGRTVKREVLDDLQELIEEIKEIHHADDGAEQVA